MGYTMKPLIFIRESEHKFHFRVYTPNMEFLGLLIHNNALNKNIWKADSRKNHSVFLTFNRMLEIIKWWRKNDK